MWWLDLDLASKEWLRENLRTIELPEAVQRGIADAGGPGPAEPSAGGAPIDGRGLGLHRDAVGVRRLTRTPPARQRAPRAPVRHRGRA